MFIAPGISSEEYTVLNLDIPGGPDWERAIEIFHHRISTRYIEAADLLVEQDSHRTPADRRFGFSILALDCLLIETLQSFREGLTDSKGKSRILFKRFLSRRENFREHFTEEEAERFFEDFRCGILHQAEIMGLWRLWSVGPLKGENVVGTPIFNRTKMHEYLKKEIECYCNELRNPSNDELRRNFRIKMDFISKKDIA